MKIAWRIAVWFLALCTIAFGVFICIVTYLTIDHMRKDVPHVPRQVDGVMGWEPGEPPYVEYGLGFFSIFYLLVIFSVFAAISYYAAKKK